MGLLKHEPKPVERVGLVHRDLTPPLRSGT